MKTDSMRTVIELTLVQYLYDEIMQNSFFNNFESIIAFTQLINYSLTIYKLVLDCISYKIIQIQFVHMIITF